jgi:hypothetical protein
MARRGVHLSRQRAEEAPQLWLVLLTSLQKSSQAPTSLANLKIDHETTVIECILQAKDLNSIALFQKYLTDGLYADGRVERTHARLCCLQRKKG